MSTRQRSFFDQDHNNRHKYRPRPHYNRTRSADNVLPANGSKTNANKGAKPIDASSQSKKKLKAFAFAEGVPDKAAGMTTNKENVDPHETVQTRHTRGADGHTHTCEIAGEASVAEEAPSTEAARLPPPSTPATRLPLADLIGNNETLRRNTSLLATPEEHILWQHGMSDATPGGARNRKRKRPGSSSPATSQNEVSNFFPDRQHANQSPQHDPVHKLWDRYAAPDDGSVTPGAKPAAEFAHLIDKSSPHSSATAGSVSGLRRWASCGAEFPSATKPKKRRTTGAFREGKTASGRNTPLAEDAPAAGASKVGRLLERIQETLAQPVKDAPPSAPASSSPLPEAGRFDRADEVSPLQRLPILNEEREVSDAADDSPSGRVSAKLNIRGSSEFGDDDLDMDMVETIESQNANTSTCTARHDVESAANVPEPSTAMPKENRGSRTPSACPPAGSDNSVYDSDADGDLFAADMETVASKYDAREVVPSGATVLAECDPQAQPEVSQESGTSAALAEAAELLEASAPVAPPAARPVEVVTLDSEDDFGSDDIDADDLVAAEAIATQRVSSGTASQPHREQQLRTIQRYLITKVVEGIYRDECGRSQAEKVLLVSDERQKVPKTITLRQAWVDTPATEGSYVHVVGQFSATGECLIDNTQHLLILHPDHLVSATTIADSFGCLRKAVLNIRVKATSDASPATLYGHMLHKLFQEAMKANVWDRKSLEGMVEKMMPQYFETMAEIGLNENQVRDHVRSKFAEMKTWATVFVRARPTTESVVKDRNSKQAALSVHKLLDVEENVESPKYGLKGMIDATVQVRMVDDQGERTLTVPFELKTGKRTNPAHQAQTMLYTLLTSDRYDLAVFYGILYYMESADMRRIPALRHELLQMIMQRNQLARYMRDRLSLPPVLEKSHLCGLCYAQTTCFVYHRLTEDGDGTSFTTAKQKFDELVRNLKVSHRDFFIKWDNLLTKEEAETMRFRRELWTMLSHERERLGRCFAHLVIEPDSMKVQEGTSKINRYEYTFIKHNTTPGFSFTESQITVGEAIVISDEKGHFALAKGYVTNVRRKSITVSINRRLHNAWIRKPRFDAANNQDFAGIMEVPEQSLRPSTISTQEHRPAVVYRLDKDEFSNGMATVRNNLTALMNDNVFRSADLRSLIIDGRAPSFNSSASTNPLPSTGSVRMNADQDAAVAKVMAASDYALVLGMPGTGKTTTISYIIRALVARKKSVLLASYTHTAVDNILLKLRGAGFPVLRIGALAKIHPEVQEFAILAETPKSSLQEVMESWHRPLVVATTCLAVNHQLFSQRTFDYCIVDEASQITLPVCLGPIRMAKTFVLVGDHYQLPPLVQNKEALEGGFDVSLFRLLSESHPEAVTNLEHQYRMAEEVQLLANKLIYSGRLKCGTEAVAARKIRFPHPDACESFHMRVAAGSASTAPLCRSPTSTACHLGALVDPSRRVLFLNTDALLPSAAETSQGTRVTSALEARLTLQSVCTLVACGVPASDVGVITFYRSQLALLRQSLRHLAPFPSSPGKGSSGLCASLQSRGDLSGLEMHTADKFQGRDKEAVVVSFVRSNEACQVGELLKDWRRINVAITRARSKLILIGSKRTLAGGGNEVLKGLIDICERRGYTIDLDDTALDGHVCVDGVVSQTQAATSGVCGSPPVGRSVSKRGTLTTDETPGQGRPTPQRESQNRRALAEIKEPNRTPRTNAGMKVPEKRGIIRPSTALKGRGVMSDLFNGAV